MMTDRPQPGRNDVPDALAPWRAGPELEATANRPAWIDAPQPRTGRTTYGIRPEILAAHRATWSVYAGGWGEPTTRIPHTATMRGRWAGYDVACSCGWDSRTGGAIKPRVEEALWEHRWDEQAKADQGGAR